MFIQVENCIINKSQIKYIYTENGVVFIQLIDSNEMIHLTKTSIYDLKQMLK